MYSLDQELAFAIEKLNRQRVEIAALKKVAVRLYNLGYHAGHEQTVEGYYTHIYECDMDEYHEDVVAEILKEQE